GVSRIKPRGPLAAQLRNTREVVVTGLLCACAALSVVTTAAIVMTLLGETISFFRDVSPVDFFTGTKWTPLFTPAQYGVLPLLAGTLLIALCAAVFAVPIGLITAIYLSEYAPRWVRAIVKPALEIIAGIPTVVLGFFALTFLGPEVV